MANDYYNGLIIILEKDLGPASQRFLDRYIKFHLHKEPGNLNEDEVIKLIKWISVSLGLLTSDSSAVDEVKASVTKMLENNQNEE